MTKSHPALNVLLAIIIGILTIAFVFSMTQAIYPEPRYQDYCTDDQYSSMPRPIDTCEDTEQLREAEAACYEQGGIPRYATDDAGCRIVDTCDLCSHEYRTAQNAYSPLIAFMISSVIAIIIILVLLYLVPEKTTLSFYLNAGGILGALIAILFATIVSFNAFPSFVKPLVLLGEVLLVVLVAFKKFNDAK